MYSGSLIKKARKDRGLKAYYIARKANISSWHLLEGASSGRSPGV